MVNPGFRLTALGGATFALLALLALPVSSAAQSLDDTDDVLDGDRYLVRADDLVVADPVSTSDSATRVEYFALNTEDMMITTGEDVAAETLVGLSCVSHSQTAVPFPQQTQTMRMFDLPYDVIVTLAPSAGASGTDCSNQQSNRMSFYVDDPVAGVEFINTIPQAIRNRWLHSAVGDFDGDGFDDLFIGSDEWTYVAAADDPSTVGSSISIRASLNTGASRTPMADPAVGDFNADGNLDVAWMGTGFSSGNKPVVHFATVCAGPVSNTVCEDAQPFSIVLSSATISPIPSDLGTIETVGGNCTKSNSNQAGSELRSPPMAVAAGQLDASVGDELVVVALYEHSGSNNCHVAAEVYSFTQFVDDGSAGRQLEPTSQDLLDDLSPHSHINNPAAIYATSGDLDWSTSVDNVAIAISGSEKHTVLVLSFASDLTMESRDYRFSTSHDKSFAGLAFGRFSSAPSADASTSCEVDSDCGDTCSNSVCDISGADCTADGDCMGTCAAGGICSYIKPSDYNLQLAAFLMARSSEHTSDVYVFSADASNAFTPEQLQFFTIDNFGEPAVDRGIRAGSFLRAGDLQGRSQRLGSPTVVRIESISQPDVILSAPPAHADWVAFGNLGTTAGFCDPDPTNCPAHFSTSNLCNCDLSENPLVSQSTCADGTELRCLVDFSVLSGSYKAGYSFSETGTKQSSNTDTTSWSLGLAVELSEKTKSVVPPGVQLTQQVSLASDNTYTHTVTTNHNSYATQSFDASTSTGFWDHVWYTDRSYNLYFYPVIGHTLCVDECESSGLCSISNQACETDDDCPNDFSTCPDENMQQLYVQYAGAGEVQTRTYGAESLEWYQPVHEPGQIFSYAWDCAQIEARYGENLCDDGADDYVLLSETPSFSTSDEANSKYDLDWSVGKGSSRTASKSGQFSQTLSETVTVSPAGFEESVEGIKLKESASFNSSESFSTSHTNSTSLGSSTGVEVLLPGTFLSGFDYSATGYIFGQAPAKGTLEEPTATSAEIESNGVIRTAFTANPRNGSWWASNMSPYARNIDIALNRPRHLVPQPGKGASDPSIVQCLPESSEIAATEDCVTYDPAEPTPSGLWNSLFYYLRGFFITPSDAAGEGPQLTVAAEGDELSLQVRVYNYSLADMSAGEVVVDFYAQEWDTVCMTPVGYYDHDQTCSQDGGGVVSCENSCDACCIAGDPVDSIFIGEDRLEPLAGFDSPTRPGEANWALAGTTFDTGDASLCGSGGCGAKNYMFWVVVWPELSDNDGNPALGAEVPDHSLTGIPGRLGSIADLCPKSNRCVDGACLATRDGCVADADCPGAADNVCGSGGTCSISGTSCDGDDDCGECLCALCIDDFSNNVGLYRHPFYVEPEAVESSARVSGLFPNEVEGRFALERVHVSPTQVQPGEKAVVRAGLRAAEARIDGERITFYAVPPDQSHLSVEEVFDQVIPFEVEIVSHVDAERVHEVHAPYFPQSGGTHQILVAHSARGGLQLLGSADLEVEGGEPTPTQVPVDEGDDDSCSIVRPGSHVGTPWLWLSMLPALVLARRRRSLRFR